MKTIILLIAVLGLVMGALGCQPTTDPVATEKPPAGSPRFADLAAAPVQEDQVFAVPSFVVTGFQETRSPEAWSISGTIRQADPAVPGLKFDRLLITFVFQDGRPCEFQVPEHGPLNDLVEPILFALVLGPDNYESAGFGFAGFQDFEATSRLDRIIVQVLTNRNKVQVRPNHWTGTFVAAIQGPLD